MKHQNDAAAFGQGAKINNACLTFSYEFADSID